MTEKRIKLGHILYGIMLSMLLVALGACYIFSCIRIYKSAEFSPFTIEAIKSHFMILIIPTAVFVLAVIGGACFNIFIPKEETKLRASISDKAIIINLSKRINYKEAPKELVAVVKSQRRFRLTFLIIAIANAVIDGAYMIAYVITKCYMPTEKPSPDVFGEFFPIAVTALSYAIIPIIIFIAYTMFANFTYARELEAVRAIAEYNAKRGVPVSEIKEKQCFFKKHKKAIKIVVRCLILVAAISLVIISIFFDDLADVASLAGDNVCAGCIGLF